MKKELKRIGIILLASFLIVWQFPIVYAGETNDTNEFTKNENIYAKLKADGSVNDAYVVNVFDIKEGGLVHDFGSYDEIKNLSNENEIKQDSQNISFENEGGQFYYQGTIKDAQLPWLFQIDYTLDGKKIKPAHLAGKNGHLKITLQIEQNKTVNDLFYNNYVMQISMTLDNNKCSNTKVTNGTLADAGGNQNATFMVLPKNTLELSVESDVKDFTMSGLTIAAIPFQMYIDQNTIDTGDLTDQFAKLSDATALLNNGVQQFNTGMQQLGEGGQALKDGSTQISNALSLLSQNSPTLINASSQINSTLAMINNQLSTMDTSTFQALEQLPDAIEQIDLALKQIEDGLTAISTAYQTLDQVMQNNSAPEISEEKLNALKQQAENDEEAKEAYNELLDAYQKLNIIQNTYATLQPYLNTLTNGIDNNPSLIDSIKVLRENIQSLSKQLSSSLENSDLTQSFEQMKAGFTQLSQSYTMFDSGLNSYATGVTSLANGYSEYSNGLETYLDGANLLQNGSLTLAENMNLFFLGIQEIPEQMQDQLQNMLNQFGNSDFQPVSFVDERNENIKAVQFIISTESIQKKETSKKKEQKEESKSFLDRFIDLFS